MAFDFLVKNVGSTIKEESINKNKITCDKNFSRQSMLFDMIFGSLSPSTHSQQHHHQQ
jgi:hypothetical protein